MNAQLKRGIVEVCILASLKTGPSYGYKIINDVSEIIVISESTLYPILRRLEASNCLTTYSEEFNGRLRKYYKLTDTGKKRISDFIDEWAEIEKVCHFIKDKEAF